MGQFPPCEVQGPKYPPGTEVGTKTETAGFESYQCPRTIRMPCHARYVAPCSLPQPTTPPSLTPGCSTTHCLRLLRAPGPLHTPGQVWAKYRLLSRRHGTSFPALSHHPLIVELLRNANATVLLPPECQGGPWRSPEIQSTLVWSSCWGATGSAGRSMQRGEQRRVVRARGNKGEVRVTRDQCRVW